MFEDRQAQGDDKTLHAVAWYNAQKKVAEDPCRNLVIVGTAGGKLKLIDIEKNRVVWKEDCVQQNFYTVDWSVNGVVAAGGMQKSLLIRKFDRAAMNFQKVKDLPVPDSVRVVKFNPFKPY